MDDRGRLTRWPSRSAPRELALDFLSRQLEVGRDYTEAELTAVLLEHHTFNDVALLRRCLFDSGRLDRERDGSRYRRRTTASGEIMRAR